GLRNALERKWGVKGIEQELRMVRR
ncbi:MAG: hypothetical protein RLZZ102_801, partial [Pseudomonadota bacterium]